MKKVNLIVVSISFTFGTICIIWGILWMMMATDLSEKVDILEQEIVEYKWQLEQVDQMICIKEVE
jgi:hypothetical protein